MGDGAVKTGSKKSADEMDKKKKKSVPNEKGCVFLLQILQMRARHHDPAPCAPAEKYKSNLKCWNIIWRRQLIL